MSQPLISVIIPAYNARDTLPKTIDSVLEQTFGDLECIIVNDGSTDGTQDIATSYTDRRIIYHFQENQERSVARNVGASLSRGKYLAFLDADDIWLPTKLEKQLELFQSNDRLGLVYCDVMYFDGQTGRNIKQFSQMSKLERGMVFEKLLWNGNFIQSPTPVVPKKVFDYVGGYDPALVPLEDWDLWLRIAYLYSVDFVPLALACYRWREQSVSLANPSDKVYGSYLRLLDKVDVRFCQDGRLLSWKIRYLRTQARLQHLVTGFRRLSFLTPAQEKI